MNKVEERIKKAEEEFKKAKAISIVYTQLKDSFEVNYCTPVTDEDGNYVHDEDGRTIFEETPIEDAQLYSYDYDADVYKYAVKLFKYLMEYLADVK